MVDIESLLSPISEQEPSGTYLKLDRSAYRSLRNSYNTAQSSFRQLIETPDASGDEALLEANQNNWDQLRQDTFSALTSSTKDLELLGWYIASQLFTSNPYQALSDSTQVLNQLIEKYWDCLHPTLPENKIKSSDESGAAKEIVEFRIKPLLQLVGESNESTALFMPLQLISLIEDITFGDYLRAERSGELAELKENAQRLFSSEVEQTTLLLAQSYQHLSQAETTIAQQCQAIGISPISFRYIKSNIADSINAIRYLAEDKFAVWPLDEQFELRQEAPVEETPVPEAVQPAASESTGEATPNVQGNVAQPAEVHNPSSQASVTQTFQTQPINISANVASRDQAFQELRKIAEYFKATEPHSPISFLLERAIRWGYMSLPELLEEMTGGNSSVITHINQLTGMDNLDKVELATNVTSNSTGEVPSSSFTPNVPAAAPAEISQPSPSSISLPTEESAPTQTIQTEKSSTESSGNLTDFEW
ncbi:type VI secretion protein [Vibrio aquaticus]|uniref:Type VI secretion protein n=1 Tax=Vibrio aquaticus TaxID=2496559 RepID=A0A3S0PMI1_9VIBR|nr:type VI secretion system ImpA family N-terminal domain-containing protein [Vibrio aquaticus]RTZ14508.1 type VI secretion protein [Vibrio aquaticus]